MTTINAAVIEADKVINISVFAEDTFEQVKAEWADSMPHWQLIPLDQLPPGCWIGWQRDDEGAWINPVPPTPIPEPVSMVPQVVTRRQARRALALSGLLDLVQPAIDSIADPTQRALAQIDWDDATEFRRDDVTLLLLAGLLGLTEEQLDDLFILAGEQA